MKNRIVKITITHSSYDTYTDILIRRANGKVKQYNCTTYSRGKEWLFCYLENKQPTRITISLSYICLEYEF